MDSNASGLEFRQMSQPLIIEPGTRLHQNPEIRVGKLVSSAIPIRSQALQPVETPYFGERKDSKQRDQFGRGTSGNDDHTRVACFRDPEQCLADPRIRECALPVLSKWGKGSVIVEDQSAAVTDRQLSKKGFHGKICFQYLHRTSSK